MNLSHLFRRSDLGRHALCFVVILNALWAPPVRSVNGDWTGTWDSHWPGVSARLTLTQDGDRVTGSYAPGSGSVEGAVTELRLEGRWSDDTGSGTFAIQLSGDGNTFFGHFGSGDWWTGRRSEGDTVASRFEADRSSPRAVLRSFLIAANAVRNRELEYIRPALDCLALAPSQDLSRDAHRNDVSMLFYDVIDRCTFRLADVPNNVDSSHVSLSLRQAGTQESADITITRFPDGWKLVVPEPEGLRATLRRLLDARGRASPDPLEHFERRNPRATMRTFLEEFKRWDTGGRELVEATMDLSTVSTALRNVELPLLAAYLKETLDRVGYVIWQEIPDDPARPLPYVHFRHPRGDIVIGPVEQDSVVVWKFTAETLATIRALYEALEDVPLASTLIPEGTGLTYFRLNHLVRQHATRLTALRWGLEIWQWLAIVLTILLAVVAAYGLDTAIRMFVRRRLREREVVEEQQLRARLLIPMAITLGVGVGYLCATNIGLPLRLFPALHTFTMVALTVGLTWTAYSAASIFQTYLRSLAEKTINYYDELLVSLLGSVIKVAIVVLGLVFLARGIGIPLGGLLAGLGVGGLAVAIAAKDTLANVFGSAVLLADRPFKRGDLVAVAGHEGYVKAVGLRSTQIRTRADSVVAIPNSVLANEIIDNLGRRRLRRVQARLGVTYDTPPDKLEALAERLREMLQKRYPARSTHVVAGVWEFGESSIDLEFVCYVDASSTAHERKERHRLFMDIMRLAEDLEVEFAFPTRTLHVAGSSDDTERTE